MDAKKKAAFVRTMGKKKRKISQGGLIRRTGNLKYFDDGGTVLGGPVGVGGNSSQTVNNHGLVGTVGDLLGMNNQFQAQGAPIQYGTNAAQLNAAYQGAQGGLNQQQELADELYGQGAQGRDTQTNLTGQLQGVINGTGPNPAQAALNQNTSANVANQAALMAGQRGAGANTGLIARQAAMQGAATQQGAIGQAATLQAQQQIAAQQQLQQLAQTQIGQQAGAIQGVNNAQQNEQNILQGANTAANNAAVTMQGNINNVNAGVAAANQQNAGNIVSDLASGAGAIMGLSKGGQVPHLAAGGPLVVAPEPLTSGTVGPWLNSSVNTGAGPSVGNAAALPELTGPDIDFKKKKKDPNDLGPLNPGPSNVADNSSAMAPDVMVANQGGEIGQEDHYAHFHNYFSGGGTEKVPAMVSPGEVYLSPENVRKVIHEGANPMKVGEKIKGKAKVKNDSLKNDTVPKTLEEGGVVIPRHIATHKMSAEKAELFVRRAIARKRAGK